jgi:hypothetical protein
VTRSPGVTSVVRAFDNVVRWGSRLGQHHRPGVTTHDRSAVAEGERPCRMVAARWSSSLPCGEAKVDGNADLDAKRPRATGTLGRWRGCGLVRGGRASLGTAVHVRVVEVDAEQQRFSAEMV